jgi:hypothetical protein
VVIGGLLESLHDLERSPWAGTAIRSNRDRENLHHRAAFHDGQFAVGHANDDLALRARVHRSRGALLCKRKGIQKCKESGYQPTELPDLSSASLDPSHDPLLAIPCFANTNRKASTIV